MDKEKLRRVNSDLLDNSRPLAIEGAALLAPLWCGKGGTMNQRGALIDLAKRINDGFNAVDSKRVEVGRLLLQAREIIDAERSSHGGPTWEQWCAKNVERSQPDIRKVIALAGDANAAAAQEAERGKARERMRR